MSPKGLDYDDEATVDATVKTDDAYLVQHFSLASETDPHLRYESTTDRCSIGSHPSNDLVLDDATVSRFHAEVVINEGGARVRDLGSRNGTRIDGVRVSEGFLKNGSRISIGRSSVRFHAEGQRNRLPLSDRRELGTMVGTSVAMRSVFAQLERVGPSEATVLLQGETGTGKEEAAATLHQLSHASAGPFVVVDCGSIPPNLLESHLFGHARGSFTGATDARIGAFEAANGGTVFLDEIGELPLDMQPKLLRVLESREVRRIGETDVRPVSVRVIAATHRDLRHEVGAARFREDLYYRLAVIRIVLPPLRERPDDIAALVERFVGDMNVDEATGERLRAPGFVAALRQMAWPGNVRQLRNYLQRAAIFDDVPELPAQTQASLHDAIDVELPYPEARRQFISHFERAYAERIIQVHGGNVSKAARAAGIGRSYLHRLRGRGSAEDS
ncbi:MAG: sigma 54-interacting transcriptional regulator [Sandaracinaceae bacterium]